MPTNLPRLGICVVLSLTTACGPLVPLSYNKEIPNTPLSQTIETDEATIFLEYMDSKYGSNIFDLEVINHSSEEIFIAPQFISFYASPNSFPAIQNTTDDVHALSAPNSCLTMKRQYANSSATTRKIFRDKVKSKESGVFLFALLTAGLIIYDAVKDAEVSKKENWNKKDGSRAIGRDLLVDVAITASDIAKESLYQAKDESQYIPYELFPECKIKPGESVRGKIFIPMETSYRFSRVVIPIQEIDYVFDFKRRGVKSTQSQSPHHLLAGAQHK